MDFQDLVSIVIGFAATSAIAFVVLCWITSYARFERMARQLEQDHRAMDPHDAFQLAISKALGTAHRMPDPFCVFVARADVLPDREAAVVEILRRNVRSTDGVFSLSEHRMGLLLRATRRHAETVYRRLARSVAESAPPARLTVGAASCPENGDRVMDLLSAAETALQQAAAENPPGFAMAPAPEPAPEDSAPTTPAADSRYIDPLTGLLRSEHLEAAVQKYMAARRRRNLPVSLVLLDVDHLDRYNSHYGRAAGDAILRAIGDAIEKNSRETDLAARLSGEEFLITIEARPADALKAAQRLVAYIKRMPILHERDVLRVTLKAGIAGYPDHGGHPRFLLEKADRALVVARERGGNTCVLYEPALQTAMRNYTQDRL